MILEIYIFNLDQLKKKNKFNIKFFILKFTNFKKTK